MTSCSNCKYYLPVDVFKGICKLTQKQVTPEDTACEGFDRLPKCRFCKNYIPDKEFLGKCKGYELAYPDMPAIHCAQFEWYTRN
ncbi:MAG TPA: 4-hydroxyphenylacetate decarboxylase small subunit [Bacteroidales bacterium]|nr:4-hydroxyphenylacetate decarboxylase small subunit [Bacteroidales bacterium]